MHALGPSRPAAGRRRTRAAAVLAAVAVLAVAAGLIVWRQRDYPRRRVERSLAESLEAEVRVGELRVLGARHFLLRDLRVRRMAGQPLLSSVRVDTVDVEATIAAAAASRFDVVRLRGVEVRLAPPGPEPLPAPSGAPSMTRIGRLIVEGGRIVLAAGGSEASCTLTADLSGFGTDLTGEVRIEAPELPLAPLLALAGLPEPRTPASVSTPRGSAVLDEVTGLARLGPGIQADVSVRSASATVPLERGAARLAGSSIQATASQAGSAVRVRLSPSLPFLRSGALSVDLDPESWAVLRGEGRLDSIDLATAVAFVPGLPEGLAIEGTADLELTSPGEEVLPLPAANGVAAPPLPSSVQILGRAHLPRLGLPAAWGGVLAEQLEVRASALVHTRGLLSRPSGAGVVTGGGAVPGTLDLDLQVRKISGSPAGFSIPAGIAPVRLHAAGALESMSPVRARIQAELETASAGRLEAQGTTASDPAGAAGADLAFSWRGARLERIAGLAGSWGIDLSSISMHGPISATGAWKGPIAAPTIRATIAGDGVTAAPSARASWSVGPGQLAADVAWTGPGSPIVLGSVRFGGPLAIPPLEPVKTELSASAEIDPVGSLRIRDGMLRVGQLGTIALAGAWDPVGAGRGTATASFDKLEMPILQGTLKPLTGDLAPGFSAKGHVSGQVTAEMDRSGSWTASGTASIRKSGFASEDGSRVLEGLDSDWTLAGKGSWSDGIVRAEGHFGGFQLLWGALFADESALVSNVTATAAVRPGDSADASPSWSAGVHWQVPGGPSLEATLAPLAGNGMAWTAALSIEDLGGTVQKHLREPLGGSIPLLEKIEAAGALSARAEGRHGGDGSLSARGAVGLRGVRVGGTAGVVALEGLDLDLPFDITWSAPDQRGARAVSGPPLSGRMRFRRLGVSGLEVLATETPLNLRADTLALLEPLSIPLLGGTLGFESLSLAELTRPTRHLQSALIVSGLELGALSTAFGLPPLEGTIEGYFPRVRVTPALLQVEGGGTVSAFGGSVRLGEISGSDVLSRYPKIAFSADFSGIDLGRVTKTFDFGEITGVVDGYLHECRLFRNVPVAFEAMVRTVHRKGVPRTVNVKAIQNISILGGGGRIGLLDRGIHRFFDRYTYDEIGMFLKLENDVFVLRGLEHRGQKELFVKGRLPFPIDVVNAMPGQTVSFRSMLERLSSIDFSAASTSAPGR